MVKESGETGAMEMKGKKRVEGKKHASKWRGRSLKW